MNRVRPNSPPAFASATITERMLTLIAIASLGAAIWMTLERESGFDTIPRSYGEVSKMADVAHVVDIEVNGSARASIKFRECGAEFTRSVDLQRGQHEYQFESELGRKPIEATLMSLGGGSDVVAGSASLPLTQSLPFEVRDFVTSFDALPEADREYAAGIIEMAGVVSSDPIETRIVSLAAHLHQLLEPHRGQPGKQMRSLNGVAQLREALSGRSHVYCANHAEIFSVLATGAGIATRIVDVGGRLGSVALGAHAFNECYLPDLEQWVYVDLQLHIALPRSISGKLLSGVDILMASTASGAATPQSVVRFASGQSELVPFEQVADEVWTYLPSSATLIYLWGCIERFSTTQRLRRLFVKPQPSFSLYHTGIGAHWRLGATYFGAAVAIAAATLFAARHLNQRKRSLERASMATLLP